MTLTSLDARPALVLNDLQRGIVRQPLGPIAPTDVVARCALLAAAFRAAGHPVVLVAVAGGPPGRVERELDLVGPMDEHFGDIVPEMDLAPSDVVISTRNWNAFYGTSLDLELRRRGITQVVLGGISTSSGVESTARSAHDRGYNVVVAVDAVTDFEPTAHQNSIERIFPKMSETETVTGILDALARRSPDPVDGR